MAYTAQIVTSSGTELDFLKAVRTFFTSCGFTVTAEQLSTDPGSFTVSKRNMLIEVASVAAGNANTAIVRFTLYARISETTTREIATVSINYASLTKQPSSPADRSIQVFIAQKGNATICNAAAYNAVVGKGRFTALTVSGMDENNNPYNVVGNISSSSNLYITENNTQCNFSPYHTYQKTEGQLFLDPELPILNNANNAFLFAATDIVGLGGAEAQHFYTGTNSDRYYCIMSNVAIKLEE